MDLTEHWPLFGLRITTPRLELRVPTDDDLVGLVDAVRAGIHDLASTPFTTPWTDAKSPELESGADAGRTARRGRGRDAELVGL